MAAPFPTHWCAPDCHMDDDHRWMGAFSLSASLHAGGDWGYKPPWQDYMAVYRVDGPTVSCTGLTSSLRLTSVGTHPRSAASETLNVTGIVTSSTGFNGSILKASQPTITGVGTLR